MSLRAPSTTRQSNWPAGWRRLTAHVPPAGRSLECVMNPVSNRQSRTREYASWYCMHSRCYDTRHHNYPRYGQRGICVCERWHDFQLFIDDMGPRPEGMTLDRIDSDGNYEPSNCRWATHTEQCQNRRNSIALEIYGVRKNLSQWARDSGIDAPVLWQRMKMGWDLERAITEPQRKKPRSKHGKSRTIGRPGDGTGANDVPAAE